MAETTANQWTEQTALGAVWDHFVVRGGKPALGGTSGSCHYRVVVDGEMRRCAVGLLIPDDQYSPNIEGDLLTVVRRLTPALQPLSWEFLSALQHAHDRAVNRMVTSSLTFERSIEHGLREVARNFGLAIPEVRS